jgi:hypothetical protein
LISSPFDDVVDYSPVNLQEKAMKQTRLLFILLIPAALSAAVFSADSNTGKVSAAGVSAAKEKALEWLKERKVPNRTFPNPQPERRNLVLSYEIPSDDSDFKQIGGRSIIYDDALAAIAFTMSRDYRNASQILIALKRLQRRDGGLWFGYNVNNEWPSEKDYDGAVERSGAAAWAGYAAVFYLQTRLAEDPSAMEKNRELKTILEFAQSLGHYLIRMQIREKDDIRYGLITGGRNSYTLRLERNAVNEIFSKSDIAWISTEHNIDAFFFLRDLGILTRNKTFSESAAMIRNSLPRVWGMRDRQYFRGVKPDAVDSALALDCASWGSVFSLAADRKDLAVQSLSAINEMYASVYTAPGKATVRGYKPYAVKEIYEEVPAAIAAYYFPELKNRTWDEISGVWVEGTLGVALAFFKNGDKTEAEKILGRMIPLQSAGGGFVYFTRNIPHEFSTHISTASTAWFVIVASAIEDPAAGDRFWKVHAQ